MLPTAKPSLPWQDSTWNPYRLVYSCTYPHVHGIWPHVKCYRTTMYTYGTSADVQMYIHPMSRFEGSVKVYTLMYHIQTGTYIFYKCTDCL